MHDMHDISAGKQAAHSENVSYGHFLFNCHGIGMICGNGYHNRKYIFRKTRQIHEELELICYC